MIPNPGRRGVHVEARCGWIRRYRNRAHADLQRRRCPRSFVCSRNRCRQHRAAGGRQVYERVCPREQTDREVLLRSDLLRVNRCNPLPILVAELSPNFWEHFSLARQLWVPGLWPRADRDRLFTVEGHLSCSMPNSGMDVCGDFRRPVCCDRACSPTDRLLDEPLLPFLKQVRHSHELQPDLLVLDHRTLPFCR